MKRRELIQKMETAVKINRKMFVAAIMLQIILLLFMLIKPIFYQLFLDHVIMQQEWDFLKWISLGYLLLALLDMSGKIAAVKLKNKVYFSALLQLRKKIWRAFAGKAAEQSLKNAGDKKLRMDEDAEKTCTIYYAQKVDYVVQLGIAACSLVFMGIMEWHLTLMAVLCIPVTVGLNTYLGKKEQILIEKNRVDSEKINDWIQRDMVVWKQKKLLQTEQADFRIFQNYLHRYADFFSHWINYWTLRWLVIPKLKNEFVMKLGVYVLGGYFISKGTLEISGLLIFISYYFYFVSAIQGISDRKTEMIEEYPSVMRVLELLGEEGTQRVDTWQDTVKWIVVKDLSFGYEADRDVLCHVNLKIESGNIFLLRGESGCGKSTLLSVLAKILPYERGSILLNDTVELSDIFHDAWYQKISCCMQEMMLFPETIRENLYYAKPDASEEEMRGVLEMVDAWEFVKNMEHGIDTKLSENGANLSGGQRQRILLARTILKNADVYFFDEPTSALDRQRENDVMAVLRDLAKKKAVFLITHQAGDYLR